MTRERPWWASDGPVDGGVDLSEDPVERIRSARRGTGGANGADPDPDPDPDPNGLPFTDEPTGGSGSPPGDDRTDGTDGDPRPGPWWEAAAETVSRLARDLAETAEAHEPREGTHDDEPAPEHADPAGDTSHRIDACGVCPICVGLRALGESRPELVGHLAEAARHVALAARSLAARPPTGGRDDEDLQHIDLDD